MCYKIGGTDPGVYCALKRSFQEIGEILVTKGTAGVECDIYKAVYYSPMGLVAGLRNTSLLFERCFDWIGTRWWHDDKYLYFLVKRLSDETKSLWVLRASIYNLTDHRLVSLTDTQERVAVHPAIRKLIQEATNRRTAISACQ